MSCVFAFRGSARPLSHSLFQYVLHLLAIGCSGLWHLHMTGTQAKGVNHLSTPPTRSHRLRGARRWSRLYKPHKEGGSPNVQSHLKKVPVFILSSDHNTNVCPSILQGFC